MRIDTGSFFAIVGSLAAGGGAGYVAGQKHVFDTPEAPPPPSSPTAVLSARVAPPTAPALPPCDDTVGAPAACPPPGYSADENGCGGLATKRCSDFKQAMKPRVAERAVACLNALSPAERCNPLRLNLCGHLALMSACQESEDAADAAASAVTALCQTVVQDCAAVAVPPTLRDCRATLAGMSELGRSKMAACLKTHCADKSLLYCEALVDIK